MKKALNNLFGENNRLVCRFFDFNLFELLLLAVDFTEQLIVFC